MAMDDALKSFMDKFKLPDFSNMDWKGSTDGLRQSFYRASRSVERDLPPHAGRLLAAAVAAERGAPGRDLPELSKRLKAMKAGLELIQTNAPLVFDQMAKAVGCPPHKVDKLRKAHTAAEKAMVFRDAN